jgi:hypothetical protein
MPTVESRIAAMAPAVREMDVMKWLLAASPHAISAVS